jgi:hypothetical protein
MTLTSSLRDRVAGPVVAPGEAEYEDAWRVCNFMIDKHPAVIAEHQSTVVARGIEWSPALVAVSGG